MGNREIKFRAWYYNKMQCCFHISDEGVVCECYYGGWGDSGSADYHKDAILMQYTGLKDKNGIEIYEGDIVQFLYKHPENSEPLRLVTCEIFWHPEGAWCLKWPGKEPYLNGARLNPEKYEIIGNIYQNPELCQK